MAKTKITCDFCGERSKSKDTPASCPACGVSLDGSSKETILKKAVCMVATAGDMTTKKVTLYLSNQRIFSLRHSTRVYLRPPGLGRMISDAISARLFPKPKSLEFSFGLDEVEDLQIVKKGPLKILSFNSAGKTIVLDVKRKHRQEWLDAMNDAKKNFTSVLTNPAE